MLVHPKQTQIGNWKQEVADYTQTICSTSARSDNQISHGSNKEVGQLFACDLIF